MMILNVISNNAKNFLVSGIDSRYSQETVGIVKLTSHGLTGKVFNTEPLDLKNKTDTQTMADIDSQTHLKENFCILNLVLYSGFLSPTRLV